MDRDEVHGRADVLGLQQLEEPRAIDGEPVQVELERVEVPGVVHLGRRPRASPPRAGPRTPHRSSGRSPGGGRRIGKALELRQTDRRGDVGQVVLEARCGDLVVPRTRRSSSASRRPSRCRAATAPGPGEELAVVADQAAALAGGEVLDGVEREAGGVGERAHRPAAPAGAEGSGRRRRGASRRGARTARGARRSRPGWPAKSTAMIALVRGVIARATCSGSRFWSPGRRRRARPWRRCAARRWRSSAKVQVEVITSSPGPMPHAASARWSAPVHELTARPWAAPAARRCVGRARWPSARSSSSRSRASRGRPASRPRRPRGKRDRQEGVAHRACRRRRRADRTCRGDVGRGRLGPAHACSVASSASTLE